MNQTAKVGWAWTAIVLAVGLVGACKSSQQPQQAAESKATAAGPAVPAPAADRHLPTATEAAAAQKTPAATRVHLPELDMQADELQILKAKADRFAPVELTYDASVLGDNDRKVVALLTEAADIMGQLFWRQASADGLDVWQKAQAIKTPYGETLRRYLRINAGRFSRLDNFAPFVGDTPKPLGATFYPPDLTKEQFNAWLKAHPDQEKELTGTFTVIQRDEAGNLKAVPYSQAYGDMLQLAAGKLREAAALTGNASLQKFLTSRADAFVSNDYYQSDCDWMDIKGSLIEATIGPYEVYEDRLFGFKAAFEAMITLNDPKEGEKLERLVGLLTDMEKNLPLPDEHKNLQRGGESPLRVADLIYSAGDTRAGVQAIAFNLPNDERVREAKGSKKVLLRNLIDAKFQRILQPIARLVLVDEQQTLLSREAYFDHTLLHEISHGLGPGTLKRADGTSTTVGKQLKELYSAIEEAKADVLGIYNTLFAIDRGALPEALRQTTPVTALAGMFRTVRFGAEEAHGKANVLIFNFLMDKGAVVADSATGRFKVDFAKFQPAVVELAHQILMIEALGDYAGAQKLLATYSTIHPEMKKAIDAFADIPVDIEPIFPADIQRRTQEK